MQINKELQKIIIAALKEDKALHDITSDLTISATKQIRFAIKPRENIILCGIDAVAICFAELKKSPKFAHAKLELKFFAYDGDALNATESIVEGYGNAKLIFAAERVILNLIQHLSGIATAANYFQKLAGKTKILDTRKTIPGLRIVEKYAVAKGGAKNHRMNLADMILIKDNHIAAAGGVENAMLAAKNFQKKSRKKIKIEIECDNLEQVAQAVKLTPDIIMLDNMNEVQIKKAQKIIDKKCTIEISGGVNIDNIKKFGELGVDYISVGALTHSSKNVDIGIDVF